MSESTSVSNAVVEGCSGALGSAIALLVTYPLKTIYTLQALSTGASSSAALGAGETSSRLLVISRFLQQYKLSTLYAGLGPNVVDSALSSGVYFYFYSRFREEAVTWSKRCTATVTESRSKDIGVLASLVVATLAGACNQLITMPSSVVATRMQGYQSLAGADKRRPPTILETIASVFYDDGIAGFWKGLLPSMILLVNPAVQYMLFEKIQALLKFWKAHRLTKAAKAAAERTTAPAEAEGDTKSELLARRCSADSDDARGSVASKAAQWLADGSSAVKLSPGEIFLAGALAKIGATVVTYPLIVVKARMQVSRSSTAAAGGDGSTWAIIAATARNEGLGGFFKGLHAKILQTALNAALMLMLKDQLHGVAKAALTHLAASDSQPPSASQKAPSAAG